MSGILSGAYETRTVALFLFVTVPIVWLSYLCAFPATSLEGTPGKAMCGLKLVTYQGRRIGLGRSFSRGFLQFVAELSGRGLIRNIFAVLSDSTEMTLYDCCCDTRVIRRR